MSGGGKGGGKSSTSTSSVSVPPYLSKELQFGVEESRRLYDQGAPEFYPGQTYADLTPDQIAALDATRTRATNGSSIVDSAQNLAQRTLDGEFLNNNPYLDDLMARYGAEANSQVLGQFNKSGRLGSGANVATAAQAIGDSTLPFLFQNYQNERGLQQNTAAMAGSLAAEDYKDLAALSGVGDILQNQEQKGIDEDVQRYQYDALSESNWLDQYLNRINSSGANNLTTTTNTTKEKSGGGLGSVLGTALSLGSMFVPGGSFAGLGSAFGAGLGSMFPAAGQFVGSLGSASAMGPYLPFALCDARMKENIVHVGFENGFPMYKFNYIGDKGQHVGPVAQDVENIMPQAVKEIDGIKYVNLDTIGVKMRKVH